MEIIPAIDVINGKCVRLTQGDYERQKVYSDKPLEVAKRFADAGLKRLHLVDLDGAKAGRVSNWAVLEELASPNAEVTLKLGSGPFVKGVGPWGYEPPEKVERQAARINIAKTLNR